MKPRIYANRKGESYRLRIIELEVQLLNVENEMNNCATVKEYVDFSRSYSQVLAKIEFTQTLLNIKPTTCLYDAANPKKVYSAIL